MDDQVPLTFQLEIQRTLGRLSAEITALTTEVRQSNLMHTQHDAAMDVRVTRLERWRIYSTAFAAGAIAVIAVMGTVVWRVLSVLPKGTWIP